MRTLGIQLEHVSKAYGDLPVLTDLSISFPYGSSTCLMGPSGHGKTTLLHILMGLVEPDSGRISGVMGRRLAPVFQEDRLCENLSVGTNIRMAARDKLPVADIEAALGHLGLTGSLRQPVRELSGGMKRRVTIARALLSGGDILVFDEPFKGLDEETRSDVMDFVRERIKGKTLIWVTHDPQEAAHMGSEVIHFPLEQNA